MAVNFDALNQVYNHYLTTYAPKSSTSLDTHKKSELKSVYNSIVKLSKESPLYLLNSSDETKNYAVSLKENARGLRNTILSLGGMDEEDLLSKKIAYSTNEDLASASYIGSAEAVSDAPAFSISVEELAMPQVNMGSFLPADQQASIHPDTYSLDVSINDLSYEFQFNVSREDTNQDIQNRLSRLINNANIGLNAELLEDGSGNSALKLSSTSTGIDEGKSALFRVSDTYTSKTAGMVDYLGIGEITRNASNAAFTINGEAKTAYSNHFTIDKTFEIHLNGISQDADDMAQIGIKTDTESLKENIHTLIGSYNDFMESANAYQETHPKSAQLLSEMSHIAAFYSDEMHSLGVGLSGDGTLSLDEKAFGAAMNMPDENPSLTSLKSFANSVLRKTNQVSLNPMNYVEKTIVAYKNPGKNFATPYVTSAYSGMMFNSYC